jgi:hypothetical protein
MRWRNLLVLALVALSGCITIGPPSQHAPRHSDEVTEEHVKLMIARFGPRLYLCNDEKYLLDDPEYILDVGARLSWGIVNSRYASYSVTNVRSRATSAATLYDDARDVAGSFPSDAYRQWIHISDAFIGGNLRRAKATVRVLPAGTFSTELQFWFFYPYNGPARVRVRAASGSAHDNWLKQSGRHYGDWELVSIIVSNSVTELESVYMSRHSGGETFHLGRDGEYRSARNSRRTLETRSRRPIVYSAVSSHAHYPSPGIFEYERVHSTYWVLGTASADLFDRATAGVPFNAYEEGNYRIVSSDMPGFEVTEPTWLDYSGPWGQYERLSDKITFKGIRVHSYEEVGQGPSGPKRKREWHGALRAQ